MKIFWIENSNSEQKLHESPYQTDAGLDLSASRTVTVPPQGRANIPCGISVALPPETCALVVARSSTNKMGLFCFTGLIDEGYRGPMFILTRNMTKNPITVEKGQRLAQLLILPNLMVNVEVEEVDKLPEGERGTKGFGSSGDVITANMEENPELYFDILEELKEGKETTWNKPRTKEDHKEGIKKALDSYAKNSSSIERDVKKYLGITPDWKTKTNSKVLRFLREKKEENQDISKFASWWWNKDWRGKKGQPPTTVQIRDLWPQAFGFVESDDNLDIDIRKIIS